MKGRLKEFYLEPKEEKIAQKMKEKGYNYILMFRKESEINPCYFYNAMDAGPFLRTTFPNEKPVLGMPIEMFEKEINENETTDSRDYQKG